MKFIIFTGHEDTPIDDVIKYKIPTNVIKIYAVNAIYNNEIVTPFPYGIQRKLTPTDNKEELLLNVMKEDIIPSLHSHSPLATLKQNPKNLLTE